MIDFLKKVKRKLFTKKIKYQFEGPFDSSYSLAMLNKNAALTFEKRFGGQVSLYSLEGGGDFKPNQSFLDNHPAVNELFKRSQKAIKAEVTFRNCYPPNVKGMKSKLNILNSYGWEESAFPTEYVKEFNKSLDGIIAVSNYVKKVLISNGVKIPIKVIANPVDHILHVKPKLYQLKGTKSFRFLHISSCFPRKGVDILLEAYAKTFTNDDDVVLIIKTFPNPHNDIEKQIQDIQTRHTNAPEIELINKDLDESCISWLYQNTDVLVAPSRGEGFGLPMAEAMLFDLPVITTGYGGQIDFCTHETSWLIDYSFQRAKTHLNLFNSSWVEPSIDSLSYLLKEQTTLAKSDIKVKTNRAKQIVQKELRWENYLKQTLSFIQEIKQQRSHNKKRNLAWISTYNTKCGIASYSQFLLQHFQKHSFKIYANNTKDILSKKEETGVIRCWNDRFDNNNKNLIKKLLANNTTHIVINFNFAFFSMKNLQEILDVCHKKNIKTTIIFHSVKDVTIKGLEASLSNISETLKKVDALLVHSIQELNTLKSFGLVENTYLFPHGAQPARKNTPKKAGATITIASYGFLLPQKGIKELIIAFSLIQYAIPNIKLLLVNSLYPAQVSKDYLASCKEKIKKLNLEDKVELRTDFLSDEESLSYLDTADLLVMPYQKTNESSSAAVRYAIATCKPVLCTKQAIFDDVADVVHFADGFSSQDIANAMQLLLSDTKLLQSKSTIQEKWIQEHSWEQISKRLQSIML